MKKWRKRILVAALILVLLTIALVCFISGMRRIEKNKTEQSLAEAKKRVPVTAVQLIRKEFVAWGEYTGKLEAANDVMVTARVRGTVVEDLRNEGDQVTRNQSLYRQDDDTYRFAMQQAEAAVDLARENLSKIRNPSRPEEIRRLEALGAEAETALEKAKSDAARFDQLYRQGAVSLSQKEAADLALASSEARAKVARENLEQATTGARVEDIAAAEAGLRQAEAAYQLARDTWEEAVIRSPISGIVAAKHAFLGDTLEPGMPVAEVVDLSSFKINLGVSGPDISYFAPGDEVMVQIVTTGREYNGTVRHVGVKADDRTGSFPVIIEMANPDPGRRAPLRAGMDVNIRFVKQRVPNAIVIPTSALLREVGQTAVFVVEDNIALRRDLVLGPEAEGEVAVFSGLSDGNLLVVIGQRGLQEGDEVELSIER